MKKIKTDSKTPKKATKEEALHEAKIITKSVGRPIGTTKLTLPIERDYTPTKQQEQAFNEILSLISEGMPAYKAIDQTKMLTRSMFTNLLNFNEELKRNYAQATEEREIVMFDKALEVATYDGNDWYYNERGAKVPNPVAVQRSRLITDTILKMLATMNNKKYGNKTTLQGDADNPIIIQPILGMIVE